MKHLMDSATNEYKFTNDFLGDSGRDAFSGIFSRTLSLVLEQLETYLFTCYDALGLLLMIKLNHGHRRIMHSRQVHVLDTFFDRVTMLLWPRLKMLLDSQVRAIRAAGADAEHCRSDADDTALGKRHFWHRRKLKGIGVQVCGLPRRVARQLPQRGYH